MGARQAAEDIVNSMKEKAADIKKVEGEERPEVYFVISYGEYGDFTAGGKSFINELITMAGQEYSRRYRGGMASIQHGKAGRTGSGDNLIHIQANPGGLADTPGYKELTAIKENRLIVLDDNLINRAGPRLIEGLEALAKGIHPDLFN